MAKRVNVQDDRESVSFELSRFAGARFSLLMACFACALILTVWGAIALQLSAERSALNRSLAQQTTNLSLIFKSSVNRTASEMDRVLRYLRATYERNDYQADWPTLVQAEFAANKRTVQIAVIAEDGMMITSSKMLYPKRPIDLSFRKHYQIHAENQVDRLYISEPLVGKASGKWSVQFARPFFKKDRTFGGVIVVSLNPNFLTRDYASLDLGRDGGLAVLGNDGTFRAVSGRYEGLLGKTPEGDKTSGADLLGRDGVAVEDTDAGPIATAVQQSSDFPLRVITTRDGTRSYGVWRTKRKRYHWGGVFFYRTGVTRGNCEHDVAPTL